jgi:hypothetical protein
MPVAYPLNLRTIIRQGKSRSQPAAFRLSEPRRGYAYVQATGTDTPVFWDITLKFTQPEAALFQLWFTQDLQRGVLEFTMPIRTEFGLVTHTCRFLPDSLLPVQEDGEVFVYTAQIMARAQIIPAGFLAGYPGGFVGPIPTLYAPLGGAFAAPLAGYWTGGLAPFRFDLTAGTLPPGIGAPDAAGVLQGAAPFAGTHSGLVVTRTDALGISYASNEFSVQVEEPDPYFSNVVLLLNFEGADASTAVIDSSQYADHKACNTNQQISTNQAFYGASSLRVSSATVNPIAWSGSRFARTVRALTVEGRHKSVASYNGTEAPPVFRLFDNTGAQLIHVAKFGLGNTLSFRFGTGTTENLGYTPDANGWVHWEIGIEEDGTTRVFFNGVVAHTTSFMTLGAAGTACGVWVAGTVAASFYSVDQYIDGIRVTAGVCRHTAAFTPPTRLPTF